MAKTHRYSALLTWTGAARGPTADYAGYSREFDAQIAGKPAFKGSADPTFRGDPSLHNPEELLVIALASCHMLSYLAECAMAKIAVVAYEDAAEGTMAMAEGRIRFTEVVLRPRVRLAKGADLARAEALHQRAHDVCFIANSVNFPVRHEASVAFDS